MLEAKVFSQLFFKLAIGDVSIHNDLFKIYFMVAYYKAEEVKTALKGLISHYVEESKKNGELPRDFIELIKHNFYAKFAYYNKQKEVIEVGINETRGPGATYPTINIYSFPINETDDWMERSIKPGSFHIAYYSELLRRYNGSRTAKIVVI